MSNSTTTAIIGSMFLIASFFSNYDVNIICASIFFCANFVIRTLNEQHKNGSKKETNGSLGI